ncbi:hypothetical protein Y032_0395g662 [Ancylostoma ceylanicum]|uniref:Uncharacterized protein n=2 Tax=Ancylostoma ceylanicum TaxID=53326 RepID=A0A016RRU7_9BILA|nr:hypothetical protein Y032_0395g662 [Ancylostoma ceylanicum]
MITQENTSYIFEKITCLSSSFHIVILICRFYTTYMEIHPCHLALYQVFTSPYFHILAEQLVSQSPFCAIFLFSSFENRTNDTGFQFVQARNNDIGIRILSALIEQKPIFAKYYGFETSLSKEELEKSELFLLQARRIQNFLDTIVSSLGVCPDSAIHHMSYRVGQIHYYKGVNFGADNWLVFKKVTVDQVVSLQKKPSVFSLVAPKDFSISEIKIDNSRTMIQRKCMVTIGWNRLMGIVIREMKRGFLEEAQRNCQDTSSS